jgi:predicted DNA-binding transcriptional regulator AlpA
MLLEEPTLHVISVREFAKRCGLSVATVKRIIAAGDGPPVFQLSPRRIGIRLSDAYAWIESRVRS